MTPIQADDLFKSLRKDGYQLVISTDCVGEGVTVWINKGDTTRKAVYDSHPDWKEALRLAARKLYEDPIRRKELSR